MPDPSLDIEHILTRLEAAPQRIAKVTVKLKPTQLHARLPDDEWSINDVLAHLRACNDEWGKVIRAILAGGTSTVRTVSPRTWMRKTDYPKQEFRTALAAFTAQRADLVRVLKPLTPKDWSRTAPVMKDGKVRERSVMSFAEQLENHEGPHIEQIEQMAAAWEAMRT